MPDVLDVILTEWHPPTWWSSLIEGVTTLYSVQCQIGFISTVFIIIITHPIHQLLLLSRDSIGIYEPCSTDLFLKLSFSLVVKMTSKTKKSVRSSYLNTDSSEITLLFPIPTFIQLWLRIKNTARTNGMSCHWGNNPLRILINSIILSEISRCYY